MHPSIELKPGMIIRGPALPEPVEILTVVPLGPARRVVGKGLSSGLVRDVVLTPTQLDQLQIPPARQPFDGDATLFRLGVEAQRLGLACEYDPFFSLSIARVDPLPHQLEAVYDHFLKLPRIRFLLADDPGAGKTIMAGLLLKELKARGLVKRALIVAPANLTFQWQRELKDKFREQFEVMRSDVLRANYGQNPWQDRSQVVTSISWVSRVEDARESLLRSHWDLIIVDEAHKMSAYADDKKTLAYKLGESLSSMTDHYLLMTATPHKGDPENFCLFLSLLDRDVYGSVESLQEAMRRQEAPFYLRRTKEALTTFPDPETGHVHRLFTNRDVRTAAFDLDGPELDFYDQLTRYVEDQSIRASGDDSARGRAVGFTMAMLQRRMASTVYAVRRTLERMKSRREQILADPEKYRREQVERRLPDDFDELTEEEQQEIISQLEDVVASVNPADLRLDISRLSALIDHARVLERREVESKLVRLKAILTEQGVFSNPKTKLLVFTEHKDSLDFLVGDGQDGRPYGKLREWGLTVTQIHGGMKIGDRDTAGTRIWAEREFRENAQVLVATEAAGEGINLQFCWLMVNYDIPWNPVRLEQRVGRIHRYGQEHDCLVFNFAAVNTREGRVLQKLLERLKEIRRELGTDQVFDVVGEVFPANLLERLFRDMYARRLDVPGIEERIVREVNPQRFRAITNSALEGLARRSLNLSAVVGRSVEARERRLVPEVIARFFLEAAPVAGVYPKPVTKDEPVYRVGRLPRTLLPLGDRLEAQHGGLAREYGKVVFDKALLTRDATLEWVTPGHPLFEVVREDLRERAAVHLGQGAVFFDINRSAASVLDVFGASIKDGRGQTLHRRLLVVETDAAGAMTLRQPTVFLDIIPAPAPPPVAAASLALPDRGAVEGFLYDRALQGWLDETTTERASEIDRVTGHVRISLDALLDPPYFAAIPYADLSDVFYVWLRRGLGHTFPDLFRETLVAKPDELIVTNSALGPEGTVKDGAFFSAGMGAALTQARVIAKPKAIGCVVFADASTASWEAMLLAVLAGGWIVTASWPIDTEMQSRTRARSSASLQSSIFLVCRPRERVDGAVSNDEVGDWRDVLAELPRRIHEWMPRLAEEGVVGADAIFACLGPALEIFSRYSRVEKASGEPVLLREYLEHVWAAVSNEALSVIFKDADAAGLEPDARLTAMWLWTVGADKVTANGASASNGDDADEAEGDDEDEVSGGKKPRVKGFAMEFDAARKIAQGLGVHLEKLDSLVEINGETARLLPVAERTRHLFGKNAQAEHQKSARGRKKPKQGSLFEELQAAELMRDSGGTTLGEGTAGVRPGQTVLDRIHQAMILFAAGRTEAMKRLLVEDGAGTDPRFWKLAQSLSALYPAGTDEKRWVDGVLARKKGLGLHS